MMRALLVLPIAFALVLVTARALATVTGDALSAIVLELILLIITLGCFVRSLDSIGRSRTER